MCDPFLMMSLLNRITEILSHSLSVCVCVCRVYVVTLSNLIISFLNIKICEFVSISAMLPILFGCCSFS